MENNLELIINTSVTRFEQWLRQYVPISIPDYVDNREGKPSLYIGSPIIINKDENKFIKILGSPYLKEDYQGLRLYEVNLAVGELDSLEEGAESELSIPLLEVFETLEGRTNVIIRLSVFDLNPYYKDMNSEIARLWPETKRAISSLEDSTWFGPKMDNILFDCIIEAEPQKLMEWIHAELRELLPSSFNKDVRGRIFFSLLWGDYFLPDDNAPRWDYVIYEREYLFDENKNSVSKEPQEICSGAIARIELRHIINNRYHIKCLYGLCHPQILKWLKEFEERLTVIYQPIDVNLLEKKHKDQTTEIQKGSGRKGGRPRNPDNDWAYEQVRVLGREPVDVYPEWLNRIGDRKHTLLDPRDSFNKAIRVRMKEEKTD